MKFGLRYASLGRYANGPAAVEVAQAAEAAGFDSIWTVEHVVVPHAYQSRYPYSPTGRMGSGLEDFPIPDPLIWLAYIASATRTIKLGTAILILPQRNPVVTAKAVATLDHAGGRTPRAARHRRRLAGGRVRGARRAVRGSRAAHRRVRRRHAHAVDAGARDLPGPLRVVRRGLLPAAARRRPSRSSWAATRRRPRAARVVSATATFRRGARRRSCSMRCAAPPKRRAAIPGTSS